MKTFPFPGYSISLPEIVRAENCSLFDVGGKRYVDMESGVWCTSVGHANPAVNKAAARQMNGIGHVGFCYSSPMVEQAAETIQRLAGHEGGRCTFLCSGSEAVEYGVRAMRTAMPDAVIMTMADSYFGAYGDAASRKKDGWFAFDWFDCEGCKSEYCSDECPRWNAIPFDEIGGFLFEPGSSSGLVRFPPAQLMKSIEAAIRKKNGLFMVNEVTTGVGRTGKWFGYQHYDVRPDIVALGKGIGNGFPVSVSSMNADVVRRLGDAPIAYGQSHLNDPLGAAVVQAVVREIEGNGLIERAARLSGMLLGGLNEIAAASRHDIAVRGRGLMAVMDMDIALADAAAFHERLVSEGYICVFRPGSTVLRMDPALTIEEADLQGFLAAVQRLLQDI